MSASRSNTSALSNNPQPSSRHRNSASTTVNGENSSNVSRDQPTPTIFDPYLRDMPVDERRRWVTGRPNSTTNPTFEYPVAHLHYSENAPILDYSSLVEGTTLSAREVDPDNGSGFTLANTILPQMTNEDRREMEFTGPSSQTDQGTSPTATNRVEGSMLNGVPSMQSNNALYNYSSATYVADLLED
jgi:hypothetical protein